MSAHYAVLRAERPRLLRAAVRRLLKFRAMVSRRAAQRRRRLVQATRDRFDERAWVRHAHEPHDDPRFHRWRPY